MRIGLYAGLVWLLVAAPAFGRDVVKVSPHLFSPLIETKLHALAKHQINPIRYPQYTSRTTGQWILQDPDTWTSGFFPVTMYAMHERSHLCKDETDDAFDWIQLGRGWSSGEIVLEGGRTGVGHDVGFLSMPFVQELNVNPSNATALTAVLSFAKYLASRYSTTVGCTRSWDSPAGSDEFKVIIDNMMNLELLFVAGELTNNVTLSNMAISHADHTLKNHIRKDGSSYHLVTYSESNGTVTFQGTSQGYADWSTWSRGQAWGIFGFANMFERTKAQRYLDASRNLAQYYLSRIPTDRVVPWDFDAPVPATMDSSAMAIAARGLLSLARHEIDSKQASKWTDAAITLLNTLAEVAWYPSWASVLANGTANNRAQPPNNLTGLVYGDYYFIDAGNELIRMGLASC